MRCVGRRLPHHQDVICPAATDVLLALMRLHHKQGWASVRTVGQVVGMSGSTAFHHLRVLREFGLVDWEPARAGTLRPLVVSKGAAWSSPSP